MSQSCAPQTGPLAVQYVLRLWWCSGGAGLLGLLGEGAADVCICTLKARGCVKNDGSRPVSPLLHDAVAVLISSLGMLSSCQGVEEACELADEWYSSFHYLIMHLISTDEYLHYF
jgi:hypothetical protein